MENPQNQFEIDNSFILQTLQNKVVELTQKEIMLLAVINSLQAENKRLHEELDQCTNTEQQ